MSKVLTPYERETVILGNDGEGDLAIMTLQRKMITKLDANPMAECIGRGSFGDHPWAKYKFPASMLTFRTKKATRPDLKDKPVAAGK